MGGRGHGHGLTERTRQRGYTTKSSTEPSRLTYLAFDRLFFEAVLQMLLRYSDGLSRVLESALANLGGINGSTMCLLIRWDV